MKYFTEITLASNFKCVDDNTDTIPGDGVSSLPAATAQEEN